MLQGTPGLLWFLVGAMGALWKGSRDTGGVRHTNPRPFPAAPQPLSPPAGPQHLSPQVAEHWEGHAALILLFNIIFIDF